MTPSHIPAVHNGWTFRCLQLAPHQTHEPNQGSGFLRDPKVWPGRVVEVLEVTGMTALQGQIPSFHDTIY